MRKYKEYTSQQVKDIAELPNVKSMAELLRRLDLKPAGGNYINMKRMLQVTEANCSHWTGQAWNHGQRLKDWKDYTKVASLKQHLIQDRGHQCQRCGLKAWLGESIPLEVHHVDGDRTNNDKANLRLECNNCHALTPNWRNRKN